ncbi:MAG: TMEM175 family protein [Acidobacteriota bacterium]
MSDEIVKRGRAGFRLRGLEMSRIETFTDAAFAFALTLLVISLTPPMSLGQLTAALAGVPSFVASATMLMMFWWGHHEWSRYGLNDSRTLILSCLLVFTMLVYVYPLRFMFGIMFEWIGRLIGVPLRTGATIGHLHEVNKLFAIYSVGFFAMSGALLLLHAHAWSQRDALGLDAYERHETRASIGAWLILAVVGLLATVVAIVVPPSWTGAPGWLFACLGFLMPLYGRAMDRRRPTNI